MRSWYRHTYITDDDVEIGYRKRINKPCQDTKTIRYIKLTKYYFKYIA